MNLRIAMWAGVGALVALFWALYISAIFPTQLSGFALALIHVTCPVSLIRHYPVSFYAVVLVNAATYALVGAVVESIRQHYRRLNVA